MLPTYCEAHHDLAIAFEAKCRAEPEITGGWLQKAISTGKETYRMAPNNPALTADDIVQIGQRMNWLEGQVSLP